MTVFADAWGGYPSGKKKSDKLSKKFAGGKSNVGNRVYKKKKKKK